MPPPRLASPVAAQEQFAARAAQGDARPAAKVTRVSRPAAAAAAATRAPPQPPRDMEQQACAVHGPTCTGHHSTADPAGGDQQQQTAGLLAAMQSALAGIVGEVQERPVAAAVPPQPPTAASAARASGAFPTATHRKLSKFALGRQQQRSAGAAGVTAGPPAVPAAAGAGQSEESAIDAENRQLLAAMAPDQVAEAQAEVLERLPPAAADFLRRRGAAKAAAARGGAAAAGGSQRANPSAAQADAAGGGDSGAAAVPRRPQQLRPQQPLVPASATAGSLVSRLRFDIDGTVVGLRPASSGADVAPAEVTERDPLRCGVRRRQHCSVAAP